MRSDEHHDERDRDQVVRGVIASVDTAARTAMVTVDAWDGGSQRHGPCPYQPHGNPDGQAPPIHPKRDDGCVVLEDEHGSLWIGVWRFSPS